MARAITSPELTKLRGPGQWSALGLAIHSPATVYTARVNQTFTSLDQVAQVTYDGGSGTLASVLAGMTMYVGSIAGAYDKGMVRIRKTPSATVFYIGETSDIDWDDDDYLTVVNEFGLWPKHIFIDPSNVSFMDYDIAYAAQHSTFEPVPVLGPIAAVLRLTGATVVFSPSAASSWLLGGTITGYSWSAPGASATANLTTATPTITYNAAGTYRVSCTVTGSNSATATGYRWVFVNPANPTFALEDCSGDYESGYWSFSVTGFVGVDTEIRDRAMVTLWARDWYGTAEGSIGPVTGYENVICTGWIDGESIEWNPKSGGGVKFSVRGPGYWLEQMPGYPTGLQYSAGAPTAWTSMQGLTTDRALWHLFHWRSTVDAITDVYLTGDTRKAYVLQAPSASLWEQVNTLANQTILARAVCDRYGRLFVSINEQYVSVGSRAATIVQALTKPDWVERVDITRHIIGTCANVDASGVAYDGSISTPLFSKASGKTFRHFGRLEKQDQLLVADQTGLNELAGLILAQRNNEYPAVDVNLIGNNRMIDIAPAQCVTLTIATGDTPRGIAFTDKKFYPRRVEYRMEQGTGYLSCSLELEAETSGPAGITIIPPIPGTVNIPPLPPIPPLDPFTSPWIPNAPPEIPPEPPGVPDDACPLDSVPNGPFNLYMGGTTLASLGSKYGMLPCKVRSSSHTYKSAYLIQGTFYKKIAGQWVETTDDDWYTLYALDASGARILTATRDALTNNYQRTGYFNPPAATNVSGFELAITASSLGTITGVDAYDWDTGGWHTRVGPATDTHYALSATGIRVTRTAYHVSASLIGGMHTTFVLKGYHANPTWQTLINSFHVTESGQGLSEIDYEHRYVQNDGGLAMSSAGSYVTKYYGSPYPSLATWADVGVLPYSISTAAPDPPFAQVAGHYWELAPTLRWYLVDWSHNDRATITADITILGDDTYKIYITNALIYNVCSHD